MLFVFLPVLAAAADVTGSWNLKLVRFGEEFAAARIELKVDGSKLTGTLNELKQLTNLNRDGRSYLTVVLVGQPELRDLVANLPAINQRISLRFHVNPLSLAECPGYFQHRLKVAGHPTGELFQADAVELAFQSSLGVPRELNRIAKLALEFGWVKGYSEVTMDAVDAVVRDLKRQQNLSRA